MVLQARCAASCDGGARCGCEAAAPCHASDCGLRAELEQNVGNNLQVVYVEQGVVVALQAASSRSDQGRVETQILPTPSDESCRHHATLWRTMQCGGVREKKGRVTRKEEGERASLYNGPIRGVLRLQ